MAKRWLLLLALAFAIGCQSGGRAKTKIDMLPAASLDERPRPQAVAAPRGQTGGGLSTAALPVSKKNGEEESLYEYPLPNAPKDVIELPKADLPAPPQVPLSKTPPALPGAPEITPPMIPSGPLTPALPQATLPPQAPAIVTPPLPTIPVPIASPPVAPTSAAPVLGPPMAPSLAPPVMIDETPPKKVEGTTSSLKARSPAIEASSTPMATTSSDDLAANLRRLYDKANQRYASMDTYTMRMRRREVVGGRARPEEIVLAKFRKEPFSVYLKWVGEEGKNREVCYVKGRYEGAIHTLMSPTDLFLFAGKYFKVQPDSPLVKSNSRYPVTEAGMGPLIQRFGKLTAAVAQGQSQEGTAKYLGLLKRPEFDEPVEGVLQTLPPKADPLFPAGGQRFWYFDTTHGLPVLIVSLDENQREVEYYVHDRIQAPGNLDDDDFNPHRLWKAAGSEK